MSYFSAYRARATGNVYPAGLNILTDMIVRPGIEKSFGPLLLYRGAMNRGHAHRLWNFALLMYACEAETLSDGIKIAHNPGFSQLCGPVRVPEKLTLFSFFGRLTDNPGVTRNINGFTDYVRSIGTGGCWLTRVDRFSDRPECAEWRKSVHPDAGRLWVPEEGVPKSQQLFYPFMVHDAKKPDDGQALVQLINQAVPKDLPEQLRADVCQDLIVSLLAGDISVGQIHDHVKKYIGRNFGALDWKYSPTGMLTSLNAPVSTDDDRSRAEMV